MATKCFTKEVSEKYLMHLAREVFNDRESSDNNAHSVNFEYVNEDDRAWAQVSTRDGVCLLRTTARTIKKAKMKLQNKLVKRLT